MSYLFAYVEVNPATLHCTHMQPNTQQQPGGWKKSNHTTCRVSYLLVHLNVETVGHLIVLRRHTHRDTRSFVSILFTAHINIHSYTKSPIEQLLLGTAAYAAVCRRGFNGRKKTSARKDGMHNKCVSVYVEVMRYFCLSVTRAFVCARVLCACQCFFLLTV